MAPFIFYRGPDVLITDQIFLRRTEPPRRFAIRDLRDVGIVRGEPYPGRASAAYVVAALLIGLVAGWRLLATPTVATGVALAGGLAAVLLLLSWRRRPRVWQLRASYGGADVVLFACTDCRRFNQVARGLTRAMEAAQPPANWYDLAAG